MEAISRDAMNSEQMNRRNLAVQRWSVALLVLNFIGAAVYVVAASNGWVIQQERELGLHSTTGEPFIWVLSIFPVCAVFFVLNLTWGGFILARKRRQGGIFWLLTIPIWLAAVVIDFAHH
jgi:hypothetical protein